MGTTHPRPAWTARAPHGSPRRTGAAVAVAAALTLALTGCQTGTEEEPTPLATPAESEQAPSPTPEPEPEPTVADEPDDDGAGAEGLVNGPNSITAPAPGASLAGPTVTVSGEGTAFEATLNYHVLDAATGAVVQGVDFTMAGANGEIGPWSIDLTLDPGTYTVQVWEPDASDGESGTGPYVNLVEVTFSVT